MTTPTDEDREAVDNWWLNKGPYTPNYESYAASLAEAFMAHRLLGQRQGIEMAADCCPVTTTLPALTDYGRGHCDAVMQYLQAIRNLAPEAPAK